MLQPNEFSFEKVFFQIFLTMLLSNFDAEDGDGKKELITPLVVCVVCFGNEIENATKLKYLFVHNLEEKQQFCVRGN